MVRVDDDGRSGPNAMPKILQMRHAYALSAVSARRCYTNLEKHVSTVASESGQETWDDVT